MVELIVELHKEKEFTNPETLHQAVFIADRYLILAIEDESSAPCLIKLVATSLLIAGKMHEVEIPSFEAMSHVLERDFSLTLTKQTLVRFELELLRKLKFNLQTVSSFQFLERYLRLLDIN